jgi:polysaccharide biosynthesis protein PslJ
MEATGVLGKRLPGFGLAAVAVLLGVLSTAVALAVGVEALAAVAVALAVALGTFREPRFGLIAFVGFATILPFAVVPLRVLFALTFVDIALSATLVAWSFRTLHRRESLTSTVVGPLVLGFLGVTIVSFVLGTGLADTDGETIRLFFKLGNSILLFFTATQLLRTVSDVEGLTRALILGAAIAASLALALHALPSETRVTLLSSLGMLGYPTGPAVLRPIAETTTLRATGTAIDPNVLGGTLMLGVCLVVAQGFATPRVLPRSFLLGSAVVILLALGFTYSRGAWVGTVAALVFLAVAQHRRLWMAIAGLAGLLVAAPPGQTVIGRLASGFAGQDPAATMRLAEYQNAIAIMQRYPVFGIGFGPAPTIDLTVGVSSLYLTVGEQMGLVGLGVFLAIVGTVLIRSLRMRTVPRSRLAGILPAYQAAMVAALVAGLFDHYFFNLRFPHMVGLFWLLLATLVVTTRLADEW